ncbi:MAG: D-alanine--D-alanine ligase [Firmicutes bacterium]|nr:D-alanine--D-alanine ligase [Bacillota bacterium]
MGLKMALLYGGQSGEHEVSIMSACSVLEAIDKDRMEVFPVGIGKDGRWYPGLSPQTLKASGILEVRPVPPDAADYALVSKGLASEGPASGRLLDSTGGFLLGALKERVDVIFPLLHGPKGEDGTVQGLLELAGIPYVGAGVAASAVGMDKALMKAVFREEGIPVGDYLVYLRSEWREDPEKIIGEIEETLGYPCFVKPANLGSSVGISKARDRQELAAALRTAAEYDRKLIIEAFIDGREIECAVLGNDRPEASMPGEIIPGAEFYDYEDKYVHGKTKLIIPAVLSEETTEEIRSLAIRAFRAIDCAGFARVDFFVLRKDGRVLVNEINTIPGFTKISMYPKLWEASGLPYPRLIERLVELALERYEDLKQNKLF